MVKKLVKRDFNPLAVATSPFVARQTADIIVEVCATRPSVTELDDLAPGGRLEPLLEWSRRQSPGDVAWVGHAPDIESLAAALVGSGDAQIGFEKGAVAAIRFLHQISAGAGELAWLATAELLRC